MRFIESGQLSQPRRSSCPLPREQIILIGDYLVFEADKYKKSVEGLARETSICPSTLTDIIKGRSRAIADITIDRLAESFNRNRGGFLQLIEEIERKKRSFERQIGQTVDLRQIARTDNLRSRHDQLNFVKDIKINPGPLFGNDVIDIVSEEFGTFYFENINQDALFGSSGGVNRNGATLTLLSSLASFHLRKLQAARRLKIPV